MPMRLAKKTNNRLGRFKEDLRKNLVDELIIDIVLTLNSSGLDTTSSCSGRIAILCFDELEKKYRSKRLSFHFIPERDIFVRTLIKVAKQCKGLTLVRIRGFIIDMEVTFDTIVELLKELSLKTVLIKPSKYPNKIVVEIKSPISLDIPLLGHISEDIYYIIVEYLWRNLIDLNIFRNILWYTVSEK